TTIPATVRTAMTVTTKLSPTLLVIGLQGSGVSTAAGLLAGINGLPKEAVHELRVPLRDVTRGGLEIGSPVELAALLRRFPAGRLVWIEVREDLRQLRKPGAMSNGQAAHGWPELRALAAQRVYNSGSVEDFRRQMVAVAQRWRDGAYDHVLPNSPLLPLG